MILCLYFWDLDFNMDEVCVERLGFFKLVKLVLFGLLIWGNRFLLMLLGWYGEVGEGRESDVEIVLKRFFFDKVIFIEFEIIKRENEKLNLFFELNIVLVLKICF